MDDLMLYIPQHSGILPYWLLFTSIVSTGNSIQAYSTTYYSRRIYCGPFPPPGAPPTPPAQLTKGFDLTRSPATALSARTFGTWTFIASIVRFYAAYNIEHPAIYQMVMWTYGVALFHFGMEWVYYKTARMGTPLLGPIVVSISSLLWMTLQWGTMLNEGEREVINLER